MFPTRKALISIQYHSTSMFNRTTFRVGVSSIINSLPYMGLKWDPVSKSQTVSSGIDIRFMELFGNSANLTIEWVLAPAKSGVEMANGSWNGLIGMVATGEVDTAVGGIGISLSRLKVVDYLYPHDSDRVTFCYASLTSDQHTMSLLIKPFHGYVWLALLWSFLLFLCFDCLENLFRKTQEKSSTSGQGLFRNRKHHKLAMISVCFLLKQPYNLMESAPVSIKICALIWAFCTLALTNVYFAFVCARSAMPESDEIRSLEELALAATNKQVYPLGVSNTSDQEILQNTEIKTLQIIWKHLQMVENRSVFIDLMWEAKAKHNGKRYAIMAPRERANFMQIIVGRQNLNIPPNNGDSSFYSVVLAYPVQKSSPFIEPFSKIISRTKDVGLVEHWKNLEKLKMGYEKSRHDADEIDSESPQEDSQNDSLKALNMEQLSYIFYLFLMLIIWGISVFIIELGHHFFCQNFLFS